MTDIDVSQIKVGDLATVVVIGVNAAGRSICVRANGEFEHAWIPDHAIVSHTPAPKPALKVGDRVRDPNGDDRTVIWIEGPSIYFAPRHSDCDCLAHDLSEVETWERLS